MNNLDFRNIAVVLLTSFSFLAHCQQNITFNDSLQIGKYKGVAEFEYKIIESDTLLDGPFLMRRSSLGALLKNGDYSFLFKGNFKDNYPSGYWEFEFGKFQSDSITKVLDYQYLLNITGTQESARGELINGRPNGIWSIEKNEIEDSKINRTLFKSTIDFKDGVPQKSFRIENDSSTLVGRFLRNGLAHDEWTLYSENDIGLVESWFFTNGRLRKVETNVEGELNTVDFYTKEILDPKTIILDENYLKILNIIKKTKDTFNLSQSPINTTLKENSAYYRKIDEILSKLGKSAFYPKFKVKVPYYPLDSMQSVLLDSAKVLYKKSRQVSESLLGNTQLNILKMADDNALFFHSVVDEISKRFLDPLAEILEYHESNILQYVSLDELVSHIWPDGTPSDQIIINVKEQGSRTFSGFRATNFNINENSATAIHEMASYAFTNIDSIQGILNERLTKDKRQQEFIALEEQIIAQVNQLNKDLDSLVEGLPQRYLQVFDKIKSIANENLSEYSKMNETPAKRELGTQLVNCFKSMDALTKALAQQPSRAKDIEDKYQDAIWNPFMATIMNEEVKKRITTAYQKILVPHILNSIKKDLGCDNVDKMVLLLNNAHLRMLEMRDEDTSRLERKLKREQDPLVIIQLFNLEPLGQTEQ